MIHRKFREKYAATIEFAAVSAWIAFCCFVATGLARVVFG